MSTLLWLMREGKGRRDVRSCLSSPHRVIATVIEQEFFPSEVLKARARETMTRKQRTEVEVPEVANGANTKEKKKNALSS